CHQFTTVSSYIELQFASSCSKPSTLFPSGAIQLRSNASSMYFCSFPLMCGEERKIRSFLCLMIYSFLFYVLLLVAQDKEDLVHLEYQFQMNLSRINFAAYLLLRPHYI